MPPCSRAAGGLLALAARGAVLVGRWAGCVLRFLLEQRVRCERYLALRSGLRGAPVPRTIGPRGLLSGLLQGLVVLAIVGLLR
eukprot:5947580-Alexandrium_andersonii.AAC.1